MKHFFYALYTVLLLFYDVEIQAQFAGLSSSAWGGVALVSQNAAIADNKYKVDLSLGTFSMAGNNNLRGIAGSRLLFNPIFTESFESSFSADNLFLNAGAALRSPKNFLAARRAQIQGPGSFLVGFGKQNKNALAVSYHLNFAKSFYADDPTLVNYAADFYSPGTSPLPRKEFNNASFSLASLSWIDYGITYSRVLYDNGKHFFKAGVTLKLLQGLGASFLKTENADITFYNQYQTLRFNNTDFQYSATEPFGFNGDFKFRNVAGFSATADFGAVYEWRPRINENTYEMDGKKGIRARDVNLHLIAVGLAFSDIGALQFNRSQSSGDFNLDGYFNKGENFNQSFDFTQTSNRLLFDTFVQTYGNVDPYAPQKFKIRLPARLTAFLDVNIIKGFGVNLTAQVYPGARSSVVFVRNVTTITLTPRYDIKWFGAYLPISYDLNNNINLGLALRLGPVAVGTQSLLSFFMPKGVFNGDIYASVHIPLPYSRPADKDKDKVSNKNDYCPEKPGTFATRGCPDRDKDGIGDDIDRCPDAFGPIAFNGCPDTDGDSIIDKNDTCPDDFGLAKFNGCPDKDGDGVPDRLDACPNIAGTIDTKGCPDRDGDGLADRDDECPNEVGTKALKGCPDRDRDGVADRDDKCPDKRGDPNHRGCPDTDADEVFDDVDLDIDNPGPIENMGAPDEDLDSDEDGVPDKEDLCRFEKGLPLYKGCKKPEQQRSVVGESIYEYVKFDAGESELNPVSKQMLRSLAESKKRDLKTTSGQSWVILLKGYADRTEVVAETECDRLSEDRLKVVSEYLSILGVPAEYVQGEFVGCAAPLASSDNELNRQKNRVVAIYQVFAK